MCVSPGIVLATLTHWAAPSQLAARRTAAMRCDTSSCDDGLCRMVTWPRAGAPPATGAATGAVATPALDKLSTLCVCMRPGASSQLLTRADRQLRPETHFCSRALILFPSSGSSNHRPLTCRGVTTRACQSGYHNPAPGGRGRASLPERYSRYGGDISHSKLSNTSCTRFSGDSNDRGGASVSLHNRRDRTAAVPHPVPASWRVPVLRRLRMMNWKRGWVLLQRAGAGSLSVASLLRLRLWQPPARWCLTHRFTTNREPSISRRLCGWAGGRRSVVASHTHAVRSALRGHRRRLRASGGSPGVNTWAWARACAPTAARRCRSCTGTHGAPGPAPPPPPGPCAAGRTGWSRLWPTSPASSGRRWPWLLAGALCCRPAAYVTARASRRPFARPAFRRHGQARRPVAQGGGGALRVPCRVPAASPSPVLATSAPSDAAPSPR